MYENKTYISTPYLYFPGVLQDVKKSKVALQPIFEAFTNAIEAVKIKGKTGEKFKQEVNIRIDAVTNLAGNPEFSSLTINDTGIGFTEAEFARFNSYKDFTKGFNNLGTGRIQFAHYFDNTIIKSCYVDAGKTHERQFIVSKKDSFLRNNAIVFHEYCKPVSAQPSGTSVTFNVLLENSPMYNSLTADELKEALLERYIHYFCCHKEELPAIDISYYLDREHVKTVPITAGDIPGIDVSQPLELPYSILTDDGRISTSDRTEPFVVDAFRVKSALLKANKLALVSKGEVVEGTPIHLNGLSETDQIKGHKYLFLVTSPYIDARDSNVRGELSIPRRNTFHRNLFSKEEILLDDIELRVNQAIDSMYPAILEVKKKHDEQLAQLKEMFLLDDTTAEDIHLSVNDSETKILEKFYEAEAKKSASIDARIKESIDRLDNLDTRASNYNEELKREIDTLVKAIPQQNKISLTHYIARRKLVLELMQKILNKELSVQKGDKRDFDEALLHNLLFQQHSTDPQQSDLWIISEDFIYFKGSSEKQLRMVEIDGELLFKSEFSAEEDKYLTSLGENRKIKRPDVLLFPEEGKCILIEFKAPDVNIADHLTQLNLYASLIRNYTQDKFQITTFYGYLIGEAIEPNDVLGRVGTFEYSYQFDYVFQPSTPVRGFNGRINGSIYTEVIKYSTLLKRASMRNQIFLDKLRSL
jgi:hypothetical protein